METIKLKKGEVRITVTTALPKAIKILRAIIKIADQAKVESEAE